MDISSKIAQGLLSIGAVFLRPQEPFIWASGIKSPIYCDNLQSRVGQGAVDSRSAGRMGHRR